VLPSVTPLPPTEAPTETPTELPTETPEPLPTDTSVPLPTNTPEPLPTDTPEILPTDTPEVVPTDTIIPFPTIPFFTSTPVVMPTVVEPPPPSEDQVVLDDSSFVGGYSRPDGYHGHTAQWVYGQGTEYSTMTARFSIDKNPKDGTLTVLGLDSEDDPKTMMRVTINGEVVYEGPNPLPNDSESGPGGEGNWGWAAWDIENRILQRGQNTLTITNLDPSNQIDFPLFIMIDQAVISW
jgi:hypothetical protein